MDRRTQRLVTITNGSETREVTQKVANDTRTLSAHGWWVKDSIKPIATAQAKEETTSETVAEVDVFAEEPKAEQPKKERVKRGS